MPALVFRLTGLARILAFAAFGKGSGRSRRGSRDRQPIPSGGRAASGVMACGALDGQDELSHSVPQRVRNACTIGITCISCPLRIHGRAATFLPYAYRTSERVFTPIVSSRGD